MPEKSQLRPKLSDTDRAIPRPVADDPGHRLPVAQDHRYQHTKHHRGVESSQENDALLADSLQFKQSRDQNPGPYDQRICQYPTVDGNRGGIGQRQAS